MTTWRDVFLRLEPFAVVTLSDGSPFPGDRHANSTNVAFTPHAVKRESRAKGKPHDARLRTKLSQMRGDHMPAPHCSPQCLLSAGESYLLLDRSLRELVAHLASSLPGGALRCAWPLRRVEWRRRDGGAAPAVTLFGPGDARLTCDRCSPPAPFSGSPAQHAVLTCTLQLPAIHRATHLTWSLHFCTCM